MKKLILPTIFAVIACTPTRDIEILFPKNGDVMCVDYSDRDKTCSSIAKLSVQGDKLNSSANSVTEINGEVVATTDTQTAIKNGTQYCMSAVEITSVNYMSVGLLPTTDPMRELVEKFDAELLKNNICVEYKRCGNGNTYALSYTEGRYSSSFSAEIKIFSGSNPLIQQLTLKTHPEKNGYGLAYPKSCK